MTLAEFKDEYRWDDLYVKVGLYVLGYSSIGLYLFAIIKFHSSIYSALLFFSPLFAIGLSALYYVKARFKLTKWDNGLTMKQNEELLRKVALKLKGEGFIPIDNGGILKYDNYLRMHYRPTSRKGHQIRLFADEGCILINGHRCFHEDFFNYRSASRFQKEVLQFMKDSV